MCATYFIYTAFPMGNFSGNLKSLDSIFQSSLKSRKVEISQISSTSTRSSSEAQVQAPEIT